MLPEVPRYFVRTTTSRTPCRKALFNTSYLAAIFNKSETQKAELAIGEPSRLMVQ